jgi:hypothetical protein
MGLDMYLEARIYTSAPYGEQAPDQNRLALEAAAMIVGLGSKSSNIDFITLTREVAYWRKANAVHAWFVRECQGGTDNCRHAYVGREQLEALRDLCAALVASKDEKEALEKLPPQSGFFFGDAVVDDWYWRSLASTVEQLNAVLSQTPARAEFYYHSSW